MLLHETVELLFSAIAAPFNKAIQHGRRLIATLDFTQPSQYEKS